MGKWYKIQIRYTPSGEWEDDEYRGPFLADQLPFYQKRVERWHDLMSGSSGLRYEKCRIVPMTPEEIREWNNG